LRALRLRWLPSALAAGALAGCFSAPRREEAPPAPVPAPPPAVQSIPDAQPRVEPKSRYGNPPLYEVFGKRYYVLSSSANYVERGVASWYGPGFHQEFTSTREPYDMYGMTAAHKTLPLPAYARVTNLQNGRSVVVRINDRGPFVDNRIIDLSYTAAARLDMLRNGTAMVEVRAIDPAVGDTALPAPAAGVPAPAAAASGALFVQAGAFADPANAQRLAAKLRGGGFGTIFIRDDTIAGRRMYRVRIGPVPDVPEFDRIVAALGQAGVHDAHLAPD
jgi:rare lipoprotein A